MAARFSLLESFPFLKQKYRKRENTWQNAVMTIYRFPLGAVLDLTA